MQKQTVAIVGAGRVGSVLAKAFNQWGYPLVGIASKTLGSADKLAKQFGVSGVTKAADITQYADIVLIATPDRCIDQVAIQIAQDGGFRKGQLVLHTSGGVSIEVLSPASDLGAFTGCMHPLQSFANRSSGVDAVVGIYFALGGHEQAVRLAEEIVKDFGGQSFIISDKDRPLYHGAACIVSNYFVSLMHWATQIYGVFGLTPQQAAAALMPLVQGTVNNIQQLGPTEALTGPVSRGDGSTVAAHLAALKKRNENKLYAELGLYTIGVALEKATINEQQATMLRDILSGRMERLT
ncbi:MAG: protein of unknown function DUF2520-containing protein [Firmicutes bacterium]|nr:protein of unknown function DUF2520-containing protein [Bacillota bacterium]